MGQQATANANGFAQFDQYKRDVDIRFNSLTSALYTRLDGDEREAKLASENVGKINNRLARIEAQLCFLVTTSRTPSAAAASCLADAKQ